MVVWAIMGMYTPLILHSNKTITCLIFIEKITSMKRITYLLKPFLPDKQVMERLRHCVYRGKKPGIRFLTGVIILLLHAPICAQSVVSIQSEQGIAYSKLIDFDGTIGENPNRLILTDDCIYGTCFSGGSNNGGTIFRMNRDGTGFQVSDFSSFFGNPLSISLSGSYIYGTTLKGGYDEEGVIFKIDIEFNNGPEEIIYFGIGYEKPVYDPIIVKDDIIYLFTYDQSNAHNGYVVKLNTDGTNIEILAEMPVCYGGDMVMLNNDLYVLVLNDYGGARLGKITIDPLQWTCLYSFSNGTNPDQLAISGDKLFGVMQQSTGDLCGTLFSINLSGTDFKQISNIPSSSGDGFATNYIADLKACGSYLYGSIYQGGSSELGSLFRISNDGSGYKILHEFKNYYTGTFPGIFVADNDTIYGAAFGGVYSRKGVLYELAPFNYLLSEPISVNLPIKAPAHIYAGIIDSVWIEKNGALDLDTLFWVDGNQNFEHLWNGKNDGSYTLSDHQVQIISDTVFYVLISNAEGCSFFDSTSVLLKKPSGLNEMNVGMDFKIHPNPNNGEFSIIISGRFSEITYEIFSVAGEKIAEGKLNSLSDGITSISHKNLSSGVYIIVFTSKNTVIDKQKLIINQ